MKKVKERFLRYVTFDTQSNPTTGEHPSTQKQFTLARALADELKAMGAKNVRLDNRCYVYAEIPATQDGLPAIGFIAHLDTEPVCSGTDVKPVCALFNGEPLQTESGKILSPEAFPVLQKYLGQEIVFSEGNTLLGADDKAGVAEIMTAAEYLLSHPEIKHGKIGIAFTPDEEIGEGADGFDVAGFACDYAYTVDGGEVGELGFETFNAAKAVITLTGRNIHPGSAKGKMVNCAVIAGEFLAALPQNERPENTEGREGFFHVEKVQAEVENGEIELIIRDHDSEKFAARKELIQKIASKLADKYGEKAISVTLKDQYRNCYEVIKDKFESVERARKAYAELGITPMEEPVRGGTDGSTLSFMGLPCPNLFTGEHNAHSIYEFVPVPSMEKAAWVIVGIVSEK